MQLLRFFLKLILCVSVILGPWPAQAQDVRDLVLDQQEQINDLNARVSDLKAESELIKDMLKNIIATQAAAQAAAFFRDNPELGPREVEKGKAELDKALADIANLKLPGDLKARIEACLNNMKAAASDPAMVGDAITTVCPEAQAQKLLDELKKVRDDAVKKWEDCRKTLEGLDDIGPINLPSDPSGLSQNSIVQTGAEIERLLALVATKGEAAKQCGETLKESFEEIQDAETGAEALSAALSLAASVCWATGGNPYVCGAMFVIALLLELFGDKGDGGDGEGEGEGDEGPGPNKGEGIDGKGVGGECTINCGEEDDGGPGPDIIDEEIIPGLGGDLVCRIVPGVPTAAACARKGTTEPVVTIDAAKGSSPDTLAETDLTAAIAAKDFAGAFFCSQDGNNFIRGIILASSTAGQSHLIGVDYEDDQPPTLLYPPASIETPADPAAACASFQQ